MKKVLAVVLALSLGGCANLQGVYSTITGATVSPTAVIVAGNTFDALEATATNYVSLPRCQTVTNYACSNRKAIAPIRKAVRAGRVARNNLEQFLRDNPGKLGPTGLYNALNASIDTLKAVFEQYNVGATQ